MTTTPTPICGSPETPTAFTSHLLDSTVETWRATVDSLTDYWTGAVARAATPAEVVADASRWLELLSSRRTPRWAHPHEVVDQTAVARLRDFSNGSSDPVVPTLVLPPQAGHDSCIVDYSSEQSQMETIRAAGLERGSTRWTGSAPPRRRRTRGSTTTWRSSTAPSTGSAARST